MLAERKLVQVFVGPGRSRIPSRETGVTRRGADRARHVQVVKEHPFASEPVEIGSEDLAAVGARLLLVVVVDQEEDDVGSWSAGGTSRARREDNG